MCTDEERVSTLRVKPNFTARLRSLFRGVTYRIVIAHRGPMDKAVVYFNDTEIGSVLPHSTRQQLPWGE